MEDTSNFEGQLQSETRSEPGDLAAPYRPILVPGLTILSHPNIARVGEQVALPGLASGRSEGVARGEPAFSQPGSTHLRPLADPYISRAPIRFSPGRAGVVEVSVAETRTTLVVNGELLQRERELSAAEVGRGVVLVLSNRVVLLLSLIEAGPVLVPHFGMIGQSPALLELCREIERIRALDVPVLLRGETGTGKELAARALHEGGPRSGGPYLAVNMGAIPSQLAAAELFGAARGAFTGADRKRDGFFVRAHGGTLFLDEIGETPPEVQVLLLRALESREVQPVGGSDVVPVDVRLLAATDADLEQAVAQERFRAPLLYRLSGYCLEIPPLAARREDIGRLFFHFLRQDLEAAGAADRLAPSGAEAQPFIPPALVARLALYDWPGNVRQLRNAARQIAVAGQGRAQVPAGISWERSAADAPEPPLDGQGIALDAARGRRKAYRDPNDIGEDELIATLRAHRWRLQPAAAALGVSRPSLYDRIDRSTRVRKAADLTRSEIEAAGERCGGNLDAMVEVLEVSRKGLSRRMTQLGLRVDRPQSVE